MRFFKKYKIYIIFIALIVFIGIIGLIIYFNKEKMIAYVQESEEISFLKDYQVNQFVPVYVTDEQMVSIYYNDYINKMLYDRQKAYDLLHKNLKKKYFKSYNDYDNYVNEITNSSSNFAIKSFSIEPSRYETLYKVVDENNDIYVFHVIAVMQYSVEFIVDK